MQTIFRRLGLLTIMVGLLGVGPVLAGPTAPNVAGELKVEDNANLFSADAIRNAKSDFANWVSSKSGREVTIWTIAKLPDAEKSKYDAINEKDTEARKKFLANFAKTHAKDDHAKGVYILICRSPGYVSVLVDKEMRDKGFTVAKEDKLENMLLQGLRDAAKKPQGEQQSARDSLLKTSVEYLENNLPAAAKDVKKVEKQGGNAAPVPADERRAGGGWGGLLCVGLIALGVIWMIVALIKAVFRMAGGGGGMAPGYGGGYGAPGYGGGMGFFGTFLTGMFGAAAGMWMYDSFFGHHGSQAYGADNYGSAASGGGTEEVVDNTGAGDFSGDNNSGGYYDNDNSGGAGGGDWGGGGGDWGGGGGGGGGDGDF